MKIKEKIIKILCVLFVFIPLFTSCGNAPEKQKVVDYLLSNGDEQHFVIIEQFYDGNYRIKLGYVEDKFVVTYNIKREKLNHENETLDFKISFNYYDKQLSFSFLFYDNNNICNINLTGKVNTYKHQYYGIDESSVNKVIYSSSDSLETTLYRTSGYLDYMLYALEDFLNFESLPYIY